MQQNNAGPAAPAATPTPTPTPMPTPAASAPASASASNFSLTSLFTSSNPRTPRTPRRPPATSSVPPTSTSGDSFQARESSSSNHRRALTVGSSAAGAGFLRKNSLSRKSSLHDVAAAHSSQQQQQQHQQPSLPSSSRFRSLRRRANSISTLRERDGVGAALAVTRPISPPPEPPPALPDYALPSVAKLSRDADVLSPPTPPRSGSHSADSAAPLVPSTTTTGGRMLNRSGTLPANGFPTAGSGMLPPPSATGMQGEAAMVHQHIQEMANKRISTLEYLRKAHEGRVYWFNTLLFDKPDLARMPYFDSRRLARRATNYLLLGLSLPTVIDLNSNTPMEFLRSFNLLLTEFDSFQSLHPETGGGASALGRARIPNLNVFRRATPSAKARRSSSATNETLYESDPAGGLATNGSGGSLSGPAGGGGGGAGGEGAGGGGGSSILGNGGLGGSASVVSFGQSEADLLPGEEYVHLLTPSLPFDPDFFETFATLCDVLIDAYSRLLGLLAGPRDCNAAVAELFTKADAKVRKIIVQGIVKEFEDTSRNGVRTEVANVGKIVLSGLM